MKTQAKEKTEGTALDVKAQIEEVVKEAMKNRERQRSGDGDRKKAPSEQGVEKPKNFAQG